MVRQITPLKISPLTSSPLSKKKIYIPGQGHVVKVKGIYCENTWRQPAIVPKDIDANPFIEHLHLALGSMVKVEYLLDLLAFKYQNPIAPKPHAVVYLYHPEGGNGKTVFATTLRHVFGETAVNTASERKLMSGSKVQLWQRTWLIAEEANVARGSDIYDIIKTYSGQDEIEDDTKHAHFATYKIHANLIMLSNRSPSFLEPHDRRFFVSEWHIKMPLEEKKIYFSDYINWLQNEDGYAAIAYLLANRKVNRNMHASVPITPEKEAAMSLGQDACVRSIVDFLEDSGDTRLFTEEIFNEIFENYDIKQNQRKHKLTDAGLRQLEGRLCVGSLRERFWYRQQDKIESKKGIGTIIKYTDPLGNIRIKSAEEAIAKKEIFF